MTIGRRGRFLTAICLLLPVAQAWLLFGCSKSTNVPPTPDPEANRDYFTDQTADSGLAFTYGNGEEADQYTILESLGGGVAVLDYDGDGLLDVFVTGGGYFENSAIKGHPSALFKNLGNWKFKDVTAEVGLDRPLFYTHGCAVADYDNDGWPDLLVTGWGRLALYHNEPDGRGGRRFVDVTRQAGLNDHLWSTSAAWADLDGDGYPDLYVCHYVNWSFANNPACRFENGKREICAPDSFKALPHVLYRNNGNGTFTDVSEKAGLLRPHSLDHGKGLGVIIADFDGDGRPDIYVANDRKDNFLYRNRGEMTFEEVGNSWQVAKDDHGGMNGSMGVDVADYDGSGRLSLFVTNFDRELHALYRNHADGVFTYASYSAAIGAIGVGYVGFGTGFIDFDRDGAEDIFITNGHVLRDPDPPKERQQKAVLLRNLRQPGMTPGQVRFQEVSHLAGDYFRSKHIGRGAAFADLDNDGKTDIVVSHLNEPVVLLQNTTDNTNHWLGIEAIGKPYRDAVGAKFTLEVGGRRLVRVIKGGGSYLSASDRRIVFGLGKSDKVDRLTVAWPSGEPRTQTWENLAIDRYHKLEQAK